MTDGAPAARQLSVFMLLTPAVRQWRLVALVAFAFALPTAVVSMLLPPVFLASTTFTGQYRSQGTGTAGLAGLAGRLGISIDPGGANMSPDFMASVLQSREILKSTMESRFRPTGSDDTTGSELLDLWETEGPTPERRLSNGIRTLRGRISVRVSIPTGIVTLSVKDRSPRLAADIANRMVELLNEFNLQRRQSQSREGRRFAEERLRPAEAELREAETAHLRFLQSNRQFATSPLLAFEGNRLERVVQLKQEIYNTLSREFEEARIAEVRDTPLLTVIDPAVAPDKRLSPRRRKMVMLAGVLGVLVALGGIYARQYLHYLNASGRPDYDALRVSALGAWQPVAARLRRRRPG